MMRFTQFTAVAIAVFVILKVLSVESSCHSDEELRTFYRANVCHLHKNHGSCKLKWKRFYYNRVTGTCEQFFYEGEKLHF